MGVVRGIGPCTHEHPLEVLYTWLADLKDGDVIPDFHLAVCIGSAVTGAHLAFVIFGMKLDLLGQAQGEDQKNLARRFLKALVIHCISNPKGAKEDQVFKSVMDKAAASKSTRPDPVALTKDWFQY